MAMKELIGNKMPISEVIKKTGFTKAEGCLLTKAIKLGPLIDKRPHIFIGGFGIRARVNSRFTNRMKSSSIITDLDIVFLELPETIKPYLVQEKLVDRRKYSKNPMTGEIEQEVKYSRHNVYHLNPEYENASDVALLYDICFFEGRVGRIKVENEDIQMADPLAVYIHDGENKNERIESEIRIADEGLLLATTINADVLTNKRAMRALYMLETLAREGVGFEHVASRFVEILKRSGFGNNKITSTVNNFIKMVQKKNNKNILSEFRSQLARRL